MPFWSGAGGGLIGAAGSLAGSGISAGVGINEAKKARKFQSKVLKNQIQWKVADLKAAGLNPILAAGGAFSGGAPSPVQPNIPDFGQSAAAGARAGASSSKTGAEKRAAITQAEANSAVASNQGAQAMLAKENTKLAGAKTATEAAQRDYFTAQATSAANNARVAAETAKLIQLQQPRAIGEAEMWDDPTMKRFMQIRHIMAPGGFRLPSTLMPKKGSIVPPNNRSPGR